MANLEKYKEKARTFEAKGQWAKALEEYTRAIEEIEGMPEIPEAELPLYNKAGDLHQKVGDAQMAVTLYERAIDKYQDIGLANNAIALCNKVVRLAPGRSQIYLKLGMLFASKGFGAEAKTNLLEYADRMQKAGQLEEAFKALKKFAEMTPGQDEIWSVLAQQLRASARTPDQKQEVEKLLGEFEAKEKQTQQRRSRMSRHQLTGEELPPEVPSKKGELIFLDLDEPPRRSAATAAPPAPPPPAPTRAARPPAPPPPAPKIEPLEIEQTSLAAPEEEAPAIEPLEIETTSLAERESAPAADLGLEPTALIEPEPEPPAPPESEAPAEEVAAVDLEISEIPAEEPAGTAVEGLPMLDVGEAPPELEAAAEAAPELEEVRAEAEAEPVLEVAPEVEEAPVLEVAPEPEAAPVMEVAPEVEEAPVPQVAAEPEGAEALEIEVPVLEEPVAAVAPAAAGGSALEFVDLGEVEVAAGPTIPELQKRLAGNAQDWEAHRLLGEALIADGERDRGIGELDAALEGLEQGDDLDGAYALAEEVLRLEPNSVRHHQKRVELAYRQGDRMRLADAYLELADALLRSGEADKAVAVYQRVLEHDPANERAKSAVETLAPPPTEVKPPRRTAQPPAAAAAPVGGGDFVDLGAMLLDEEAPVKDTRMRIEDEEPSGDEQKDFQTMLAAFKKGVEANVEETDFQSHYDLGVAYKEMGLLDEAIAEFQKALRAPDGKLRASEALGLCFFEKGQFTVAETILRRALDLPATGDAERVGLLYWLGRAQEEVGKRPDALASYNRVFAVDITFQDVRQRVKTLSHAGA